MKAKDLNPVQYSAIYRALDTVGMSGQHMTKEHLESFPEDEQIAYREWTRDEIGEVFEAVIIDLGLNGFTKARKPCPICDKPLHPERAMNALSRFKSIYICSKCGEREAFEGNIGGF